MSICQLLTKLNLSFANKSNAQEIHFHESFLIEYVYAIYGLVSQNTLTLIIFIQRYNDNKTHWLANQASSR